MAKDLAEHLRESHGSTASMAAVGTSTSRPTAEMIVIPTRADREHDQKLPEPNERPVMHKVLTDLIDKRLAIGVERYGTGLQPMNGRDAYRDLVEELVDAAVYTLQIQHEREEMFDHAEAIFLFLDHHHVEGIGIVKDFPVESPENIVDRCSKLMAWLAAGLKE
jgi:hypothetical protein